ncbi:MAG TPA: DUF4870 domain-containing protein [Pyrinomonadaceae bacterium]|jgi:uncharacterized membrane protein
MQNPPPSAPGKSSTGLDENVAALLTYILGWVTGLIFFLIEKDSKLVRFHGIQSILLCVVAAVLFIAVWVITVVLVLIASQVADIFGSLVGILAFLLWLVVGLLLAITWILCLVRAYQGKFFKLPFIGNLAENIVNK